MEKANFGVAYTALLLTTAAFMPTAANAGTIDLSWDKCSPVVSDKAIGSGSYAPLLVSVLGHDQPHRAYEFWIAIGDDSNATPDAWRFDDAGCQGPGRITIDHMNSSTVVKTCPSFQGALASVQVKGYLPSPAHLGLPRGMSVVALANAYSPANFIEVNPAMRYFLGRILFDHQLSVPGSAGEPGTCGGVEHGMCLRLIPERCNWVNESGQEIRFTIGSGSATANGGCRAVPAANSTWGQIKGQYRR